MENMSEMLGKKETLISTSGESTGIWSAADDSKPAIVENEASCPVCKGARFVHPLLPDGSPDYSRLIPCKCTGKDIEKKRADRLQAVSNLGNLTNLTFDNLVSEGRSKDAASQKLFARALEEVKKFAAEPHGWLVLVGPVGSGKTHLACAVANFRIAQGQPVFYITVADLLDHLKSAFSPNSDVGYDELFEQIKESKLLILDNLNYVGTTLWSKSKLDQLLEYRFNSRLPTLITTSMPVEEFDNDYAGHINDPDVSHVIALRKESSSLQSLDSLDLELLRNMKFDNFDTRRLSDPELRQNLEQALSIAMEYARIPQGWLIFQGLNGCGKTHLAAAIANSLREKGQEVLFIVVSDLLDHLRSSFGPDSRVSYDSLFEKIKKVSVLVLDDFGEHAATPWAQEKIYQLINYRYNARLATVITTCLDLEQIENRVSSRMVDPSLSLNFNIRAPDYRGDIRRSSASRSHSKSKG